MKRFKHFGVLVAILSTLLLVGLAGRAGAFPWSIDMFRGASVQPLSESPRVTPEGSLSVNGEAPMTREVASRMLHNPLTATPANLAAGKQLFDNDCAVCHGSGGRGDGPVRFLMRVPPADLTAGQPVDRTDGYIYGTIRDGSIVMPALGDAMSAHERWQVVLYVRSLQSAARKGER